MAWPKTDDPRVNFVTIRLTDGELADVDDYASTYGYSRSAAVRDCTERVITAEKKRAARKASQK